MKKPCSARSRHATAIAGAVAVLFATSCPSSLFANPTGAQVVSGTVSVNSPAAGQMNIAQKTPNAIVNWNSFSIGSKESVLIVQPSASSALLNRVTGNDPSVIAGLLQANGKVFLVNPAGVIFAQGSVVNVGSMIASTLNISDADFLAGKFHFVGASPGAVVNKGSLRAQSGGTIALLGGTVTNDGTVAARLGTVALGAGSDITVDFAGDGLTTLKINQGVANALLGNTGTLAADGGAVVMSVQSADALAGTVINQQGIVRAQSLSERNGHILLDGGTSGVTQVGGVLDATGGAGLTGGWVDVTGYNVALLDGSHVDASGAAGGGAVHFGGGSAGANPSIHNANAIWMSPTASIHADALVDGSGGNITAYSSTASRIYGSLSATGGAQGGNGGLIETSGHYLDTQGAMVNAAAPKGKGGTWLLDPLDAIVDTTAVYPNLAITGSTINGVTTFTPLFVNPYMATVVLIADLENALKTDTSVTIKTVPAGPGNGDIMIKTPIMKTAGGDVTLTLSAMGSIVDNGQSITSTAGKLNLVFEANVGSAVPGNSITITNASLFTRGGAVTMGTGGGGGYDGASVRLAGVGINTTGGAAGDGSVTIHGESAGSFPFGVDFDGSFINTATGSVELQGASLASRALASGVGGVALRNTVFDDSSTVTTSSGAVRIYGAATGAQADGVALLDGSSITTTAGGSIDVRGNVIGPAATGSGPNVKYDYGVLILNGAINAQASGSSIALAGSTSTSDAGLAFGAAPLPDSSSLVQGPVSITAGDITSTSKTNTLTLRASNDGTANSLIARVIEGSPVTMTVPGGEMAVMPASVDPAKGFVLTALDSTRITLFSTGPGMSIDQTTFDTFPTKLDTLILGSSTQTGLITIEGMLPCMVADCIPGEPTFGTNLTLASLGAGSQGIALPFGASLPNSTLTLASAGQVTQQAGIQAAGLSLNGPGNFFLTDPANAVNLLWMSGAGNVTFSNTGSFDIDSTSTMSYDAGAGQFVTLGLNGTLVGSQYNISAIGGNHDSDIDVFSPLTKTGGSAGTLTLSATGSILDEGSSITSTSNALSLVLDANVGNSTSTNSIRIQGLAGTPVDLFTNGGDVTIGAKAGQPGSFDGAAVEIAYTNINTRSGSASGSPIGSVTIHGQAPGAVNNYFADTYAVEVLSSQIATGPGSIELQGNIGSGTANSVGGVLISSAEIVSPGSSPPASLRSSLLTDSGAIRIYGIGTDTAGTGRFEVDGTRIFVGSTVQSGSGPIDIRGHAIGPAFSIPSRFIGDFGVALGFSTISTSGKDGLISITGSTNSAYAGLLLSSTLNGVESGGPSVQAGAGSSIVLRALNNGTSDSIQFVGKNQTVSSANGMLAILPGGVNAQTFNITNSVSTPINLFSDAAGLSIDQAALGKLSGFQTIVFGSMTQTGPITVNGVCASNSGACVLTRPTFATNITLANAGQGSQGITLSLGAALPGETLTLESGGQVTDPGGIQAAGLMLAGPGNFTLTDPGNDVGVLSMLGVGNVVFSNPRSFSIGSMSTQTYDENAARFVTLDGTNSTLMGSLTAQASAGGISLGGGTAEPGGPTGNPNTNLTAGGAIDLVMEQGVFTNAGTGTISASNPWKIWALTWNQETRGNVQPNTAQPNFYGCMFGAGCSWGGTVPTTGNHFVYVDRPTLTVTADGKTRLTGAPNPPFTYTANGFINGDTTSGTLSGSLSSAATQASPAGLYAINPAFASSVGYVLKDIAGTLTILPVTGEPSNVVFDPVAASGLQPFFGNDEKTFVYENNLQGTNICVGSNQPLFTTAPPGDTQDLLAVEWKRVRSQPNLNSCMVLNGQHGCGDF